MFKRAVIRQVADIESAPAVSILFEGLSGVGLPIYDELADVKVEDLDGTLSTWMTTNAVEWGFDDDQEKP